MNDNPIGILDSGVGGLSIWREIIKKLPNESTIYIADGKNLPYGNKNAQEIYSFSKRLVEFLLKKDVKLIIVACNTVTVFCLDKLRSDFPNIPIVGVVPVVKTAAKNTSNKKIGIISTEATAKSPYQKKLIDKFANGCLVLNIGTGKFVPLVERGELEGEEVKKIIKEEIGDLLDSQVDCIALGCSHFPFLKKSMQEVVGRDVKIFDSSQAIARQTERILTNNKALSLSKASHSFYTTGDLDDFKKIFAKLLGDDKAFYYEKVRF